MFTNVTSGVYHINLYMYVNSPFFMGNKFINIHVYNKDIDKLSNYKTYPIIFQNVQFGLVISKQM